MLGFRRRGRIEGWAVDVSDPEGDSESVGLLRRLAESTKAWIICLIIIVLATFFFIKNANRGAGTPAVSAPRQAPAEFTDRAPYTEFEKKFASDSKFAEVVLQARFITPGLLEIVVPAGASADNIEYTARMAGVRIRHDFGHRVVVQVYRKNAKTGERILVATAQWQPKRSGYFVKFEPLP